MSGGTNFSVVEAYDDFKKVKAVAVSIFGVTRVQLLTRSLGKAQAINSRFRCAVFFPYARYDRGTSEVSDGANPEQLHSLLNEVVKTQHDLRARVIPRYRYDERWEDFVRCFELDGYKPSISLIGLKESPELRIAKIRQG